MDLRVTKQYVGLTHYTKKIIFNFHVEKYTYNPLVLYLQAKQWECIIATNW